MKKFYLVPVIVIALLSLPFSPSKVFCKSKSGGMLKALDTDNDGRISKEEYLSFVEKKAKAKRKEKFIKLDSNNDNSITEKEFVKFGINTPAKPGEKPSSSNKLTNKFKKLDENANGSLSKDEFTKVNTEERNKRLEKKFNKLDYNSDGFIVREELKKARKGKK